MNNQQFQIGDSIYLDESAKDQYVDIHDKHINVKGTVTEIGMGCIYFKLDTETCRRSVLKQYLRHYKDKQYLQINNNHIFELTTI